MKPYDKDIDIFFLQCLMKPCRGWMNCLQPVSGSVWITTMPLKKTVHLWKQWRGKIME